MVLFPTHGPVPIDAESEKSLWVVRHVPFVGVTVLVLEEMSCETVIFPFDSVFGGDGSAEPLAVMVMALH